MPLNNHYHKIVTATICIYTLNTEVVCIYTLDTEVVIINHTQNTEIHHCMDKTHIIHYIQLYILYILVDIIIVF